MDDDAIADGEVRGGFEVERRSADGHVSVGDRAPCIRNLDAVVDAADFNERATGSSGGDEEGVVGGVALAGAAEDDAGSVEAELGVDVVTTGAEKHGAAETGGGIARHGGDQIERGLDAGAVVGKR